MNNLKPAAIGLYLAVFAYFMDSVMSLIFRFLGRPASYVLPIITAIALSYFIVDLIFRRWITSRRIRLLVAGGLIILVIGLGVGANVLSIYFTKLELSSIYH
jgi:hypothetical protein